jgi:hypothetical protein
MELNQVRIEDAIIAEVSHKLVGDDDLYSRVAKAVDARIEKHFHDVADAQIATAIADAVREGFDHEYQKVSNFNEKVGAKTTIRAELERMIGGYWNQRVDKQGKPTTSTYDNPPTRAEWVMMQMVADDFRDGMKQHVVNMGGALKDRLRGELHETINRLLADVFHVRSADDQSADRTDRSVLDVKAKPR